MIPRCVRFFPILLLAALAGVPARAAFSLTVMPGSLGFPNISVGQESVAQTITLQTLSDDPGGWSLTLEAAPLTNTDGVTTIPSNNFFYWFTQPLPGSEVPSFPNAANVPSAPATIYMGTATECSSTPCSIGMGFKIVAGPAQKVGRYTTQVVVTLVSGI